MWQALNTLYKIFQDVYSDVAALVEAERQRDAAKGNEVARVLEGHVKRKVIKQTVMTTVYGVTRYGARLQIEKQLKGKYFTKYVTFQSCNKDRECYSVSNISVRVSLEWF